MCCRSLRQPASKSRPSTQILPRATQFEDFQIDQSARFLKEMQDVQNVILAI